MDMALLDDKIGPMYAIDRSEYSTTEEEQWQEEK
jgi:hypothetical protein